MDEQLGVHGGAVATEAGNSNRAGHNSLNLPAITVFSRSVLRQLVILSVFAIVFDIIQLICQVCLVIQSRSIALSLITVFFICWTMLICFLCAKWLIVLSANRIEIVKQGKMLVACCQGLSILSLVMGVSLMFLSGHREPQEKEYKTEWLMGSITGCTCFQTFIFSILFAFIYRGQKKVHRIIGSWLWMAIQQHMQRQQQFLEESGSAELRNYLQAVYRTEVLQYSSAAA